MKNFALPLLTLSCLGLAACASSKEDEKKALGLASNEKSITDSVLPSLTGTFKSPGGKLRIYDDGRFTLETSFEQTRWYFKEGEDKEQREAYCSFVRRGSLLVIERDGRQYLRLKTTERKLTDARQRDTRETETPTAICEKALAMFAQASPTDLHLGAKGDRQFLLGRWDISSNLGDAWLENGDRDGVRADTYVPGPLLFTPIGQIVDVTDTVAPYLATAFESRQESAEERHSLEINPEFRTLRYVNPGCKLDKSITYAVVSDGRRIVLRSAHSSITSPDAAGMSPTNPCDPLRVLLSTTSQQELFDMTGAYCITGLGPFSQTPQLCRKQQ